LLKISIASGKGGTGKTTIAINMAVALARHGRQVTYADCDVEEPNGRLFLRPEIAKNDEVHSLIPRVDLDKCTYCGMCSDICQYNAIAVLPDNVVVFPSLCHSCGGCFHICPEKAITEIPRPMGKISIGRGYGVDFLEGSLNVGEALAPPVIREVKNRIPNSELIIIDASPGTSCPVIEAVRDSDFIILVTEPTPFGLHDLKMAVEMVRRLGIPFGVVINRSDIGNELTESYCLAENIDVLMKIPFDRKMAEMYSEGEICVLSDDAFSEKLVSLHGAIINGLQYARTGSNQR
jgi:MinD superfamily P-loop ATPase